VTTKQESQTVKVGWANAHLLMREYLKAGHNTMWVGSPGVGKTALVKLVAKELDYDLIIFHPVISDPTDFSGLPWLFKDDKGKAHAVFVPFDQLEALINAKRPTICFLDDIGQSPAAVQAACMQLVHGGNIAGKKIPDCVRFIACTNRKQDRAGVSGILEPVKSRFHFIGELVPEIEPFVQHLINSGASPVLVAFMRSRPTWVTGGPDGWKPINDIANQACPRTIDHLSDTIKMGLPKAVNHISYTGTVGKAMANEFIQFEALANRLPDVDKILRDPMNAPAPLNQETCYALMGALHSRMDRKNLGNIYWYINKHYSKEMQVVFHHDVKGYQPALIKHEAYIQWAVTNGDLLSN